MTLKRFWISGLWFVAMTALANPAEQALKQKLKGLHSYQAEFTQKVVDATGETVQQAKGKLQLQQPDKLVWQLYAPDESKLIADGNTVWQVDPFVEQVVAVNQQQAIANNPLVLLAQPDSQHWQDFSVSEQDNQFVINSRATDSQVVSLTLNFDGQQLTQLRILDRQQQTSTMTFSHIQQNIPLDPALFQFSLPKGYDLDDQRTTDEGQ